MAEEETVVSEPPTDPSSHTIMKRPRLGIPDPYRILTAGMIAAITGFSFGSARAGKLAALRFRAENAHRLPKSEKGWYLYHKSKNYVVMLESIKAGIRNGGKLSFFVGIFLLSELFVDAHMDHAQDFRSTTLVGLASGIVWSRIHSMSRQATKRMIMLGLQGGLAFGFTQDAIGMLSGRRPEYLNLFSLSKAEPETT